MWWEQLPQTKQCSNITQQDFINEIVPGRQPVVIKGLVKDWPLTQLGGDPAALCAELKSATQNTSADAWYGSKEINGRFFYSDDIKGLNFTRAPTPLSELFDKILAARQGESVFAGAVNFQQHMPSLLPQLTMPLLDAANLAMTSLWIGTATRTAAHWDLPQNLACVISGRRRFITFPIEQTKNLYFGPINNTLAGQSISLVDFHAPDLERFPFFAEAIQHAEVAELEAGDALYMPSMRIHHVESLAPFGAMVNFWWRAPGNALHTPLLSLCHALLTLRGLPEQERQSWKALFDYYIFEHQPENLAHLPEDARGILGDLTPEVQQQISTIILNSLRR